MALRPDKFPSDGKPNLAKSMAILEEAMRNGSHSRKFNGVCGGCGNWVDAIYHVTLGGVRLCADCSNDAGCGPRQWDERQGKLKAV